MINNSFNVLRGHVHALGTSAAPLALAGRISALERRHESLLQQLPLATRAAYSAQRSRAMAIPGSEKWVFPPKLLAPAEEAAFRNEHAAGGSEEEEAAEEPDEQTSAARGPCAPVVPAGGRKRPHPTGL